MDPPIRSTWHTCPTLKPLLLHPRVQRGLRSIRNPQKDARIVTISFASLKKRATREESPHHCATREYTREGGRAEETRKCVHARRNRRRDFRSA